jgi:flagellar basal-body rod protein FlgG
MNVSLYQAAAALQATTRWQEVIAQNLGAGSIPGFKRHEVTFEAVQPLSTPPPQPGGAPAPSFALPRAVERINFSPGEMKYTGAPTDVAVDGSAFFEIQLPNGGMAYTRDGEFHVNAQGQLVTKQGFPVMGDGGPLQFDMSNRVPVTISNSGELYQGTELKGRLKLTEFGQPQALTQASGGVYLANDPAAAPHAAEKSTVRAGWIEGSNASSLTEMASLMAAMRSFEANQKIIQLQDERLTRTISELGKPA